MTVVSNVEPLLRASPNGSAAMLVFLEHGWRRTGPVVQSGALHRIVRAGKIAPSISSVLASGLLETQYVVSLSCHANDGAERIEGILRVDGELRCLIAEPFVVQMGAHVFGSSFSAAFGDGPGKRARINLHRHRQSRFVKRPDAEARSAEIKQ